MVSSEEGDQNIQEEHEARISNYEEAFAKIKDATGVSDIQVYNACTIIVHVFVNKCTCTCTCTYSLTYQGLDNTLCYVRKLLIGF